MHIVVLAFVTFFVMSGSCVADRGASSPGVVVIGPNAVLVPVGRIVLARRGQEYCAIKLLSSEKGKRESDWNATYESYYQNDMSGTFLNKNAKYTKDNLYQRDVGGFSHLTAINRSKETIYCGKETRKGKRMWLQWSGAGWIYPYVYFDHDKSSIFLAPTKWGDISEVNFLDSGLKWYGYDEKRKTVEIPIEKLR